MNNETQNKQIRQHLEAGFKITSLSALKLFGSLRLSARIHDLRHKQGIPIEAKRITTENGKRIAEYSINSFR